MGYRTYIGEMPKREYNKIKSFDKDGLHNYYKESKKLDEDDYNVSVYDFGKMLFEFGKYTDFSPPKGSIKPFFKNKALQKDYEVDYEINIVTKDFLAYIIETYQTKVKQHYTNMLTPLFANICDTKSAFVKSIKSDFVDGDFKKVGDFTLLTKQENYAVCELITHVRSMGLEWGVLASFIEKPFDLTKGDEVTTSWKFEYNLFELVRIYKSFDWKRNVMVFYGY